MLTLCYIEILLQVVFRICIYIPALHWVGNNICARFDSIKSGMNLQYIPTHTNPMDNTQEDTHIINTQE